MTLAHPKLPAYRSRPWINYVNSRMPCVLRGVPPTVAAHISWNLGGIATLKGEAYKTPDNHIVPLAPELHSLQGDMPEWKFWVDNIRKSYRFFGQCVALWRKVNRDPFIASDPTHVMPAIILWARNENLVWQETGRALWL